MIFLAKKSIPVLSALRRIGRVSIAFTVIAGSSVALGLMQSTVAEATPALYTGGFTFSVAHGYATVTGLTGGCEGKFLVVPADDGAGHPVAAIGANAFERNAIGCRITGVSLPPTVTTIGSNAFASHMSLTEINIPASVTSIESAAFFRSIQWYDAAKIYFEGERPGFSNSSTFHDLMSSQVYYNSGQTGWPGENVGSATPQVSQRVAQATLSMTSSTSGLVGTPITLTSSGGSGWGGVVYQQDGNDCVLSGNVLSRASAGSCTVRVSKSPTSTFNRANSSWETINFAIPLPQASLAVTSMVGAAGAPLNLTTSGGSGNGAVTYAVTNGTATGCVESGGVLTATGFGTCNVTATKASDSSYAEASSTSTAVTFVDVTTPVLYTGGFTFTVTDGNATVTGLTAKKTGCEGKYLVVPSDDGAGHPVTTIGFKAFQRYTTDCHLSGVSIPPTVTTIASEAFSWNETMTEINIPASVTYIGNYAFSGAAQYRATKFYFEGARPNAPGSFDRQQSATVYYNVGQTGWPGSALDGYTTEVSPRISQATLSMTSSTSGTEGTPITLTSSGGSGWGGVVYQQSGDDCVLSGNVLSRASAGSCMVRASKSPTSIYDRANSSWETITFVALLPQETLTVSSLSATVGTPLTLTTSGGSGNGAVTYAVTNGTATDCAESGGVLTATSFGTCNVTATKGSDSTYLPISSETVEVSFNALTQEPLIFPSSRTGPIGTPIALTLSGGSGTGLVTYAVANGTATGCAESGGVLTATRFGTCSVSATKAADATYAETTSATLEFTFSLLEQDELVVTSTSGVAGTPLTLTYSGGSGTGAVSYMLFTFVPSSASDCVVENGTVSASSAGTCNVAAYKAGSGNFNEAYGYGAVTFAAAPTTTTTEPSTTTTQPSNTSTTTTMVPPPAESVVVALPRAETPLVADNSLSVGAELTVTFSGFAPGEFVQLIVASTPQVIGSGYANAQGVVTLSGKIPTDLASGNHTLAVYAPESGTGFNQPITVAGLVLPATGSSGAGVLYGWAMLMILLGVVWRFVSRRRTQA